MILFCLPYAGGSSAIYYKWRSYLSSSINMIPVELKGRGRRFNEEFYESIEEAVEDVFLYIKNKVCDDEYVIFGHSMGSLLSYELYHKISESGLKMPRHLFLSGYKAPSCPKDEAITHTLPDRDFVKKIMDFGGTPEELIKNNELFQLFLPIIRNDFKIIELYNHKSRQNKIECDVSILYGNQDSIKLEDISDWKNHVGNGFKIYNFNGNHFFINGNTKEITEIINSTCKEIVNECLT